MIDKSELDWSVSSVMRWDSGQEVVAYLDWSSEWYYLWFEPSDGFIDWCNEDPDIAYLLDEVTAETDRLGVMRFADLDSVNECCAEHCGDNEPAFFYEDEWGNICGA